MDRRCQSWFLLVFVLVLFQRVASSINNGSFDEDGFRIRFPGSCKYAHDEFPKYYNKVPPYPFENTLWQSPEDLGEISGVAVNPSGNVVIFHRGDRIWNYNTFNENAEYQEKYRGPIRVNTVLTLSSITGDIIHAWGNRMFYLPHGIHVDRSGNIWLTDIALHQVFKYSASGVLQLALGQRFEPGNDMNHFCQPTSVAIAPDGEIVVADGYCNSRIVLFDPRGNPKYSIGEDWVFLKIPHALTILPNREICIADRENSRITCLDVGLTRSKLNNLACPFFIHHPQFDRVFGVASYRGIIYGINDVTSSNMQNKGFTVDPTQQDVIGFWGPETSYFKRPHAIAVCPNGTALYVSEIGPNKVWKFDLVQIELI